MVVRLGDKVLDVFPTKKKAEEHIKDVSNAVEKYIKEEYLPKIYAKSNGESK